MRNVGERELRAGRTGREAKVRCNFAKNLDDDHITRRTGAFGSQESADVERNAKPIGRFRITKRATRVASR
jgi:hypothetical protein